MLGRDVLAIVAGYLLGSLNFSYIITKVRTGRNLRFIGDGNVGARNVWHSVAPCWGVVATLLDGIKGACAVLLARWVTGSSEAGQLLAGPAAMLGHCFPFWLRFRGGKGVATLVGVLLVLIPWSTLAALAIVGVAQLFLRNMDRAIPIGAIAGIFLPPAFGYPWTMMLYTLGLLLFIGLKKLIDLPHERRVWAESGWKDVGHCDWYPGVPAGQGPAGGDGIAPTQAGEKSP